MTYGMLIVFFFFCCSSWLLNSGVNLRRLKQKEIKEKNGTASGFMWPCWCHSFTSECCIKLVRRPEIPHSSCEVWYDAAVVLLILCWHDGDSALSEWFRAASSKYSSDNIKLCLRTNGNCSLCWSLQWPTQRSLCWFPLHSLHSHFN